jgi:putative FmdB family regulatory protein
MPIHEYVCDDCRLDFEQLVRHDQPPHCPRCGSVALTRQLSVFATGGGAGQAESVPALAGAGPCGTCGNPAGPGACGLRAMAER